MSSKDYTSIPKAVRKECIERDKRNEWLCCIFCGQPARDYEGHGLELHHVVPRSRGGRGIPQNLVHLCHECHERVQHGDEFINEFIKEYLFFTYGEWDETKVIWRK